MESSTGEKGIFVKDTLNLDDLPTQVLIHILYFCDIGDLGRLSSVCRRFYDIISDDFVWLNKSKKSVITNQLSAEICNRSCRKLKYREKCRIAANWKRGCYKEKLYSSKVKYMPWLILESDCLWVSKGCSIFAVRRQGSGLNMHQPFVTLTRGHIDDVCRFVKQSEVIVSGGQDGRLCAWSSNSGKLLFRQENCHDADIQCVDISKQTLVSCSKDRTVKVWHVEDDLSSIKCSKCIEIGDRVWCGVIDPNGTSLACGSAGHFGVPPLHIYDLQTYGRVKSFQPGMFRKGAAIFDIHWESPSTLITCGFDTLIRIWDTRVGTYVRVWMDPFDSAGYCLETDRLNSVFCGTAYHGRVQLWDKRMEFSVQSFFSKGVTSSPVYSMSFDACQLFVAKDSSLNVLDFTGQPSTCSQNLDYMTQWRSIFQNKLSL